MNEKEIIVAALKHFIRYNKNRKEISFKGNKTVGLCSYIEHYYRDLTKNNNERTSFKDYQVNKLLHIFDSYVKTYFLYGTYWVSTPWKVNSKRLSVAKKIIDKIEKELKEDSLMINRAKKVTSRISFSCLEKEFKLLVENDKKGGERVYLQVSYDSICTKTGKKDNWKGRKWYLSEHMTDDEVVKTAYVAFEAAVKHEIMEGFKVDGKILFNPHVDFEKLLSVSGNEVFRS